MRVVDGWLLGADVLAAFDTEVELKGTKSGALSWVTRPKPVRVTGLPNLQKTS